MEKYTNALIQETSPYLLQHAHNPVNWIAWSEDVFVQAAKEDKLVLISVGYSACHWCHVMEHECFEDEEVARLMNEHFICVKVDREERPDVDQVYMTAVQLMTQKGGWPLNCFTLPDGRPVYGGTYFPKDQWLHILHSLKHTYDHDRDKAEEYAKQLHDGVIRSELITKPLQAEAFSEEKLHELVLRWSRNFDSVEGGDTRAPKFPLPNNYEFLLHYGVAYQHAKVLKHVELTLDKMAMGGIYDQVGGGFARYAVDMLWKVPHFEKMLYDNGQLLSLYANAYKYFQKPLYKRIVFQTAAWLEREMLTKDGAFYAALDADSEGEEGKFYCWNPTQMHEVLGDDFTWVSACYNLNQRGYWEEDKYILLRTQSDRDLAHKMGWSEAELEAAFARVNQRLLDERNHRTRPGTDIKCLTSWNAMTIKGLCDAYAACGDENFLLLALKAARWICMNQLHSGKLYRNFTHGQARIDGFLEDYAHVIDAFIALYQVTLDSDWLIHANQLMQTSIKHFQDAASGMFFFTSSESKLIARKMELNDNVIPASNSVMALNLVKLGRYFHTETYTATAHQMLTNLYDGMELYGSGYSNWARLLMLHVNPSYDVCIVGKDCATHLKHLHEQYLPHVLIAGGTDCSLPILEDKMVQAETLVYVCDANTCFEPERTVESVLKKIL